MTERDTLLHKTAEIIGVDIATLKETLLLFFEGIPHQIEAMRVALTQDNFTELHMISHTIKGSASNLRINSMADTASELEQLALAKIEHPEGYEALFNRLHIQLSNEKVNIFA